MMQFSKQILQNVIASYFHLLEHPLNPEEGIYHMLFNIPSNELVFCLV